MTKQCFLKTFTQTSVFLLVTTMLLAGCSNFLKGADTAAKLKSAIDYANATSYLIKILPEKGTGNVVKPASGEALQKVTDIFEIKFETSQEYEFVTWQVSSRKLTAEQNINDYITIEDSTKPETTVTFKKELEDIIITPVVARRPKLLSKTPVKSGSLSLKDTKIQIIFDRSMDPSSIYYTVEEINELKTALGLQDTDFLPENAVIGTTNIYGYKQTTDNGLEYIYKNILIKNNETQKNINDRFEAPYFETPTTLIIAPNTQNLPDGYTYISISLDKDFCYTVKYENGTKKIGLLESQDWVYQVNNSIDNVPPKMTSLSLKYGDDDVSINKTSVEANYAYSDWSNHATMLATNNKKIDIQLSAGDEGSGLTSYFYIELNRLLDEKYFKCQNSTVTTMKTDFSSMGNISTYNGTLDLSDYPEGLYSLRFVLYDNNGIKSYWPKVSTGINEEVDGGGYFVLDDGVHMDALSIDYYPGQSSCTDLLLNWGEPAKDLSQIDIKWKYPASSTWNDLTTITEVFPASGEPVKNQRVTGLAYGTQYDFKITYTDAKAQTQSVEKTDYTRPNPGVWRKTRDAADSADYTGVWGSGPSVGDVLICEVNLTSNSYTAQIFLSNDINFSNYESYDLTQRVNNTYNVRIYARNQNAENSPIFRESQGSSSSSKPCYCKIRVYYEGKYTDSEELYYVTRSSVDSHFIPNPNY